MKATRDQLTAELTALQKSTRATKVRSRGQGGWVDQEEREAEGQEGQVWPRDL